MRFKLDENLGSRTSHLLSRAGHDVQTVFEEGLSGSNDEVIFEHCAHENRCLVSLDLDFADVVRFPPHKSSGIAVLRPPKRPSLGMLERLVGDLVRMLEAESIEGRLWIIEVGRIRMHENTAELS